MEKNKPTQEPPFSATRNSRRGAASTATRAARWNRTRYRWIDSWGERRAIWGRAQRKWQAVRRAMAGSKSAAKKGSPFSAHKYGAHHAGNRYHRSKGSNHAASSGSVSL